MWVSEKVVRERMGDTDEERECERKWGRESEWESLRT